MKLLLIGAAGHVGGILRPALEERYDCRYLDLRPVEGAADRTHLGSVTDPAALQAAAAGCEVVVQLAMYHGRREDPHRVDGAYDVHVKGMHRVLEAAVTVGARRVIYASSLSVYGNLRQRAADQPRLSEAEPPDSTDLYGLTKRLGDEVCRAWAVRHPDLSVLSLQMVLPRSPAQWAELLARQADRSFVTGPEDLCDAYRRAIELPDHRGYDAVFICGDCAGRHLNLAKAASLLGWVPQGR
ncbi:MAG: NAD(P)-dependent oxidoreductase [Fimbriimonadaceae bacterium]|nr:NAD(P)-dependent oxidoreductase [Fimbriimonadaceae bacterium]